MSKISKAVFTKEFKHKTVKLITEEGLSSLPELSAGYL